jgi:hypothetical protein
LDLIYKESKSKYHNSQVIRSYKSEGIVILKQERKSDPYRFAEV